MPITKPAPAPVPVTPPQNQPLAPSAMTDFLSLDEIRAIFAPGTPPDFFKMGSVVRQIAERYFTLEMRFKLVARKVFALEQELKSLTVEPAPEPPVAQDAQPQASQGVPEQPAAPAAVPAAPVPTMPQGATGSVATVISAEQAEAMAAAAEPGSRGADDLSPEGQMVAQLPPEQQEAILMAAMDAHNQAEKAEQQDTAAILAAEVAKTRKRR